MQNETQLSILETYMENDKLTSDTFKHLDGNCIFLLNVNYALSLVFYTLLF